MLHIVDLRYALRLLCKSPWFTLTTIAVLAGGLAISIYTWSVLDTMVYKGLPITDGQSVVRIVGSRDGRDRAIDAFTLAQMRPDMRRLTEVGAYTISSSLVGGIDASRSVETTRAQWDMFAFTRTQPLLGRGFVKGDAADGAEPVAVLSYRIWQTVFAGDPKIIGTIMRVANQQTRIVGVMPRGYAFPVASDMWTPLSTSQLHPSTYSDETLSAYARLQPGTSVQEANAQLRVLLRNVQQHYPRADKDTELQLDGIHVATFQMAQTESQGGMIFAVLNTVSLFILLLACVNVGNMLLARTNERVREIAVRVALGAPRGRLTAQMMLESAILCVVGGLLAVALAGWALHATNAFMHAHLEGNLPYWWDWGLDARGVLAAGAFIAVTVALVSALPAVAASGVHPASLLRDDSRGAGGRRSGRISRLLVTLQIVLISVVMVVGGAMALIAHRAAHIDFGINANHLLRVPVDADSPLAATSAQQMRLYGRLLDSLHRDSRVQAAMIVTNTGSVGMARGGVVFAKPDDYPSVARVVTSVGSAPLGQRLLQGRYFDSRDKADGLPTVVISAYLARTYWPHASALGQTLRLLRDGKLGELRTIVGVVSDVRRGENLFSTDKTTWAAVYLPLAQATPASVNIMVRHAGPEAEARTAIYHDLQSVDARLTPGAIVSYTDLQQKLTLMARTMTSLFIRCGLFAILLGLTGIYGLTRNAVVQRTHEIGLRRAIGASDGAIVGHFLRQGARQLLASLAISAALAGGVLYLVAQFTGIGALTLSAVGTVVALVVSSLVLGSIWLATRRCLRLEPAVSLRHD